MGVRAPQQTNPGCVAAAVGWGAASLRCGSQDGPAPGPGPALTCLYVSPHWVLDFCCQTQFLNNVRCCLFSLLARKILSIKWQGAESDGPTSVWLTNALGAQTLPGGKSLCGEMIRPLCPQSPDSSLKIRQNWSEGDPGRGLSSGSNLRVLSPQLHGHSLISWGLVGGEFTVLPVLVVGQKKPLLTATGCTGTGAGGWGMLRVLGAGRRQWHPERCWQPYCGHEGNAPHPGPDANLLHWSPGL